MSICRRMLAGQFPRVILAVALLVVAGVLAGQESRVSEDREPQDEKERRVALAKAIREAIAERQSVREELLRVDQRQSQQRDVAQRQIETLQTQLASAEKSVASEKQDI